MLIALAAMLPSACATIQTTGPGAGWREGISYHLPKGMFRVSVVENAGSLTVTLAGPVMVADPAYPLVSRLPRSGTSDNDVKVAVDPKTNLLTRAEVTSTGDVGTLVENIATAVATLQSGEQTTGTTIFNKAYDFDELGTSASGEVNAFLAEYFVGHCGSLDAPTGRYSQILKPPTRPRTRGRSRSPAGGCRRRGSRTRLRVHW